MSSAGTKKHPKRRNSLWGEGRFVLMPLTVLDCPAYQALSMHARCLLMEIARQFVRDNNGRLFASRAYMATRGWNSASMLMKAKSELLDGGFIFETVKGHRPNKASWYALTWYVLDNLPGYDYGATEAFKRFAYLNGSTLPMPKPKRTREELFRQWDHPKTQPLVRPTVQ